ncbi:nuclear transport factor 2 family protein [Sphingomonas sp. PAMC 26605]|uniref:nuclear transport factor 2 family protein n=1 Tax=Sphingomonas sp. PAMC 26605 TaxID=1112214 RepID=UPI00026CDC42|nr:nuclear transport factor 2 family protein [Sphingomonas sp. PAMC 26605]
MPLIFALLLAAQMSSQTTPVQPIVKGTGLPPPGTEEAQVMAPVTALLAGIAARDAAAIGQALRSDATATAVAEQGDGTRKITHSSREQLLARFAPGPERYDERLSDAAVEIDGDIAMVWSPYTFRIDGTLHHCGYDHFDLVREGGSWKIQNVTWSSRTTGCAG